MDSIPIPTSQADQGALLRLLAWFSPSFPVGAFAYSHGLEYAVEAGLVTDRDSLADWIGHLLRHGAGWSDAVYLARCWRAVAAGDEAALRENAGLAAAQRGSAELALESRQQGLSFAATVRRAWPDPKAEALIGHIQGAGITLTYPVAVAVCSAGAGLPLPETLSAYLHAWSANITAAGIKLIPLGQSDGQRVIAALEPAVAETAGAVLAARGEGPVGTAAPLLDWCSLAHETQYTRLFRS